MEDRSKLFLKVKFHPILYNVEHPQYRNNTAKQKVWAKIGKEFNLSADEAHKKFRNAMDAYTKYLKGRPKGGFLIPHKYHDILSPILSKTNSKHLLSTIGMKSEYMDEDNDEVGEDEDEEEQPATNRKKQRPKDIKADILLIEAIKCRPILYNKEPHAQSVRQEIWQEVADNLNRTGERKFVTKTKPFLPSLIAGD